MYVRGYVQGSENGRVVTIDLRKDRVISHTIQMYKISSYLPLTIKDQ
jgi:hypothetical protein